MIYFDNAATSMPKPDYVYAAVEHAMKSCASVGRSDHLPARNAADVVFACRKMAAEMFDADPEQVVFTMNTTHALNIAIKTLVKAGQRVVISGFEHNSVLRPLRSLDAEIHIAGTKLFDLEDTLRSFSQMVTDETAAVICTHVSNVFGYELPVREIAEICLERNVPLIVDAAQSAGVLPISLKKFHAAFIAMPGHKALLGPQGTGILLCGRIPDTLIEGGTGSNSKIQSMPDFLPDRSEPGTHNIPGIAGLLEGMRYVRQKGLPNIYKHELFAKEMIEHELKDMPNIELFTGNCQTGVLSFRTNRDCETIAAELGQIGIAVRAGLHCAPLAHHCAGTIHTGTVRISVSPFTSEKDILLLLNGLRKTIIL